uniref:Uncharacterized protein n=1 Tax=Araucaria cunninghamii TaxID=56994 RepID=A0A0D6QT21_ARACU
MKGVGGLAGLRGKQVSLTLIALICITFLIWGWESVPFPYVFPIEDQSRRIVLPDTMMLNPLEKHFSGPSSEIINSSFVPTGGSSLISAEKSPLKSESLPNVSSATEELTAEGSPPQSEKEFLGGESALKTDAAVHSSSPENEAIESAAKNDEAVDSNSPEKDAIVQKTSSFETKANETVHSSSSELTSKAHEAIPYSSSELTSKANKTVHSNSSENEGTVQKSSSLETEVCDYSEGKWVEDSHRPLYSGRKCKRWLSEMWACRLTQRPDFTYEQYRWQPDNCEMPEFNGHEFLKRMQSKTLAFVGDSLGRQQFQSMMCLITSGRDNLKVEDVGREYGLVRHRGALRPDGWAYRFPETNTTVLYYWSASLCRIEPLNRSDPFTYFAMHLDRPVWFLDENLHRFDVVVLNTGHHWNRGKINANKWVMYVNGQPKNDKVLRDIRAAQNLTVHSAVKWLDGRFNKYPNLRAFMRSISPRHFFNGDWDSGGSCNNFKLSSGVKGHLENRIHDPVAESAVKGTRVELLEITGFSQLRDEAHISKYTPRSKTGGQDCLHWCLPGVPDTWNELLFAQLFFRRGKNLSVQI